MTAAEFRKTLTELGLSQAEAARRLKVSANAVWMWCKGERKVPGPVEAALECWSSREAKNNVQTYQLSIDGEEVTFVVKYSGQAMAVPEGGRTASPEAFLSAAARREGKRVWSGVLPCDVTSHVPISEQFSDSDLERVYRQKRTVG